MQIRFYLCVGEIAIDVFVLALAESNEYLSEYPRGTQGSVKGVYVSLDDAKAAMARHAAHLLDCWEEDGLIDEGESDEMSTVISALKGDSVQILFISKHEVE